MIGEYPYPTVRKLQVELQDILDALRVTDKLLNERHQVMEAIPPCPLHGHQCVPHALDWIKAQLADEGEAVTFTCLPPGIPTKAWHGEKK